MTATLTNLNTAELVDKLSEWDKLKSDADKEIKKLQAELQQRAMSEMHQRKVKTVQFFGTQQNYALVTMARKVDLLSYDSVKNIFGEDHIDNFITEDKEPRYTLLKQFKEISSALFFGEFIKDSVEYVFREMGFTDSQVKLGVKKLKGDYLKDKVLLQSLGYEKDDIEGWIFLLHQAHIFQKTKEALGRSEHDINDESVLQDLKNAVFVEETPKVTVKYSD